jgi:hypothetical protein
MCLFRAPEHVTLYQEFIPMPMENASFGSRQYVLLKPIDKEQGYDRSKTEEDVVFLDGSRKRFCVREDERGKREEPKDIQCPRRP